MKTADVVTYLEKTGISVSEDQAVQFVRYYELLVEWNSFMNLTAITEEKEVLSKHFADSLALAKLPAFSGYLSAGSSDAAADTSSADARRPDVCRILDIGTGAGFPAIPLKIAFPQLKITMIDSLQKRIKFLNEVISQLGLTDIEALHGRAEDYAHNAAHREQYDFVVSRAVANLSTLSEYCLPYVKVNGYFVSYKSIDAISGSNDTDAASVKGNEADTASHAIRTLGGECETPIRYILPDTDIEHCLIPILKRSSAPKKYPRKAGLPAKEPLA